MTILEMQKRHARSINLHVLKSEDGHYFVESSTGKLLYRIIEHKGKFTCTCGDFQENIKSDAEFQCKHIFAVISSEDYAPAHFVEKHRPQLDERFVLNIKGKDFVLYAGVLDLATQKGLMKLEVELIQFPTKENNMEAICKATAVSKSGEVFTDYGDANPGNTVEKIAKHIIRMASTRAKGRALRDMCNIGIACLEELADYEDVNPKNSGPPAKKFNKEPAKAKRINQKKDTVKPKASEAQKKAIVNLSKRKGTEAEDLNKEINDLFGTNLENLTADDAGDFIQQLQKSA